MPLEVGIAKTLRLWTARLRRNKKSLVTAIRHLNDYEGDVTSLTLGIEANWSLQKGDYAALCVWLSSHKGVSKATRKAAAAHEATIFRIDALRKRKLALDEIPAELVPAFRAIPDADGPRNLAAHALLHATAHGTPLDLFMPDDEFQETVWEDEE